MEIRYAWLQHYAHREGIVQPFNIASGNNHSFNGTLSFVGLTTGTPFRTFRRGNVMGRARRKLTTLASGGDETSKCWTTRAATSSKYIINNAMMHDVNA